MSRSTPPQTHYTVLGLTPWANERQIRQAYRELSKLYHPDTTQLSTAIAVDKFRQLNDAYAILSNPERRMLYDQSIHFSRLSIIQPQVNPQSIHQPLKYDDGLPTERPLSGGELFALMIMLLTLVACLGVAVVIGLMRGDPLLPSLAPSQIHPSLWLTQL